MQWVSGLFLLLIWGSISAQASQATNFGLEAKSAGRAGSVTADPSVSQAAIFNPALLGAQSIAQLSFSTSQTEVALESSNATPLPSLSQTRWTLGVNIPLQLKRLSRKAGLGFSASGPYEKLRGFVAYSPEDFFNPRYGHADGQFKGTTSFGIELIPDSLFVGAGLSLYLSGAGNAETQLSETPTSRMSLDVVLRSAPVLGVYSHWGDFASALTFHEAINPQLEQGIQAKIRLNGRDSFEQPLLMRSSLYYEPRMLEWDLEHRTQSVVLSMGLSYQFWSGYESPILLTETPDLLGNEYRTLQPKLTSRNTLNPRASLNYQFNSELLSSLGYQYRPTPFPELSDSGSHALDSNTHVIGLSLEKRFLKPAVLETPLTLGVFGQMHRFTKRTLAPQTQDSKNPPAAFDFTGNAYSVGISAQADL